MKRELAATALADTDVSRRAAAHVAGHGCNASRGIPQEVGVPLCVPALVAAVEKGAVLSNLAIQEGLVREADIADVERRGAGLVATVLPVSLLVAHAAVAAGADTPVLLDSLILLEVAAGLHHGLLYYGPLPVGGDGRLICGLYLSRIDVVCGAPGVPGLLHL